MLGSAKTARKGNMLSSIGMLLAIVVTLLDAGLDYTWIIIGLVVGSLIGAIAARVVKMTSMPEMVALFNGFGGLASLLVGWAEYEKIRTAGFLEFFKQSDTPATFTSAVIVLAVVIGGITFTGSVQAWGKLSGKLGSKAVIIPAQRIINGAIVLGLVLCSLIFIFGDTDPTVQFNLFLGVVALSLMLGVLGVLPIGGGDMPVVISLLNSFSGLAAAAAGFALLVVVD
jgi:NAD(P) transhydrogenase subunit beta